MSPRAAVLAEKITTVERHLRRVAERLPQAPNGLQPMTDTSYAVILHLWQAVQVVIDLAVSSCVQMGLGAPANYGDAFGKLADAQVIEGALAERLTRAAGFRNVVAHAYEALDMGRVFAAAVEGPTDLRAFLGALARIAGKA
ncbi:MAG: DUF86 domain-containing protein [Polyangia bacterium]